jgi:hypothetical protein
MSTAKARAQRIQIMTRYLYDRMPGAEPPPHDDHGKLWGEVDGTDHYMFCKAIATLLEKVDAHVHVEAD